MLPNTLTFTTKFDFQSASDQFFVLTDTTDYTTEGIALADVVGVFKIEGPAGVIYDNTDFNDPDIDANVSLVFDDVEIPNDVDGNPVIGTYTITYSILVTGATQPGEYSTANPYEFCSDYVKPTVALTLVANCDCATVTSTDVTTYAIGGVNPTITRVHKLFYPANLELTNLTGSGVILQAVYPNVYTGTYTGKVTSTVLYTFSDGLMVQWIITGSDEIQNDCTLSLCTVYCGMKSLAGLYAQYHAVGNFAQAQVVLNQLNLIEIYGSLYYNARECGKPDDAAVWIQKIMDTGNFDENCGCGDNTTAPVQVIPFCGGSGSGNTYIVSGDSSFGTAVTSNTVGSTTTYTVRLTQTYKDLILNALQSQDLSVTAFRAAGIPEEGRGVTTVSIPNGGGTLNLTAGTSNKTQVLLSSGTMTSSYTVALPTGTLMDGDAFTIIYKGTKVLDGNNITIFGIALTDQEAASANTQVYAIYDLQTTTWYVGITGRTVSSASQDGLEFWVNGSDYALGDPVLRNMSPTYTYVCIQASGSGTNPPPASPTSNTWWSYVGNKSALYDSADSIIIDTTSGDVKILATPGANTATNFLVREADGTVTQADNVQVSDLTSKYVWKGNGSNIATATLFNEAFSRAENISIPISGTTDTTVASGGASLILLPGVSKEHQVYLGTITLAGSYIVTLGTSGVLDGDHFILNWRAICTTAGNTVTLAGQTLTPAEALSGNVLIYTYYDSGAGIWRGYKITSGNLPVGTSTQTIRFDSGGTPVASSALTNDGTDITVTNALNIGTRSGSVGAKSLVVGTTNTVSGAGSTAVGVSNAVTGINSQAIGNNNTINANGAIAVGAGNFVSANFAQAYGSSTTATAIGAHAEGTGTAAEGNSSHAEGFGTSTAGIASHAEGQNTLAGADNSHAGGLYAISYLDSQFVRGSGKFTGDASAQKSDIYLRVSTTNATPAELYIDGSSIRAVIPTGKTWGVTGSVIARQVGGASGTAGDTSFWTFEGALKNVGGTVSLVGAITPDMIVQDAAISATVLAVAADNVNKSLKITATGEANKDINWFAHLNLFEVAL